MKKFEVGSIAVIFGGLVLSLEYYGLKFLWFSERISGSPWKNNPLEYLQEPYVRLAILITTLIIIYGLVLIILAIIEKIKSSDKWKGIQKN